MASSAAHMTPQERTSSFSLASIFALRMFGLFIILPVFAVYARELPGGDSETLVGITLGIYGLTQGLLQIPFGVASDRLGRKPVIIFGLIIFALGSFLAASGANIWIVMLGRMLQGAGAISAAVTAFIADSVRVQVLTKAMAMVGASIGLTFALSLLISPPLTKLWGVSGLFTLTGISALIAVLVVKFVVPPAPQSAIDEKMNIYHGGRSFVILSSSASISASSCFMQYSPPSSWLFQHGSSTCGCQVSIIGGYICLRSSLVSLLWLRH